MSRDVLGPVGQEPVAPTGAADDVVVDLREPVVAAPPTPAPAPARRRRWAVLLATALVAAAAGAAAGSALEQQRAAERARADLSVLGQVQVVATDGDGRLAARVRVVNASSVDVRVLDVWVGGTGSDRSPAQLADRGTPLELDEQEVVPSGGATWIAADGQVDCGQPAFVDAGAARVQPLGADLRPDGGPVLVRLGQLAPFGSGFGAVRPLACGASATVEPPPPALLTGAGTSGASVQLELAGGESAPVEVRLRAPGLAGFALDGEESARVVVPPRELSPWEVAVSVVDCAAARAAVAAEDPQAVLRYRSDSGSDGVRVDDASAAQLAEALLLAAGAALDRDC